MTKETEAKPLFSLITLILNATGADLDEEAKKILFSRKSPEELQSLSNEQEKSLKKFCDDLFRGYFLLAIKGYEFTNIDRIKEKFGGTLEENYPEASKTFIRFAKTYWTFQICLLDDLTELQDYVAYLYLARFHANIASIFFPMPGPTVIPSNEREKTQRELLEGFDIDIEDFIKGNPILIRDRKMGI